MTHCTFTSARTATITRDPRCDLAARMWKQSPGHRRKTDDRPTDQADD